MLALKECGLTMNQFLEEINKEYYPKKYTYTTRLDPMAKGVVNLIEECDFKKIGDHLKSNKIYTVRIIFGIRTDSDDVLGLIEKKDYRMLSEVIDLSKYIKYFEKSNMTFQQEYHYYSSKRITERWKGKDKKSYHKVSIHWSKVKSKGSLDFKKWKHQVSNEINRIDKKQNFRQDIILDQWEEQNDSIINYIDLELCVSSGFFVRQFIRDISNELEIPLLAYHITRTKIF